MKPSLCTLTTSLLSVHAIVDAVTAHLDMKPQNITRPNHSVPLAPSPLPPPGPASHGEEIVRQLRTLTRANISRLKLVKRIPLEGDVWEPEGIVRLAAPGKEAADDDDEEERFWISAGEYTTPTEKYPEWRDGTDRSAGAGFAHFLVFDGTGRRVGDWVVSEEGDDEYHNGGIDYDGRYIWATLSQYRPNSTGTVVRVDPAEVTMEQLFAVDDHQGGIVHDASTGTLTTLNWGGRKARRWSVESGRRVQHHDDEQVQLRGSGFAVPRAEVEVVNPSHWIDYQDCKALGRVDGRELMLCSGIATLAPGVEVGGLAVVDAEELVPVWEVPFMERAGRVLVTKNPMDVAVVDGRVRLYFAPEERTGAVCVYELRDE